MISAADFDVNLMSSGKTVVNFCMTDTKLGLVLRNNTQTIKLSVKSIQLLDPNAPLTIYRKVISIVEESKTFFEMEIVKVIRKNFR